MDQYQPIIEDADDEVIWRYLDLPKFVEMLSSKSLFFSRVDQFDDPFEGSVPKLEWKKRLASAELDPEKISESEIKLFSQAGQKIREYVYVNCWHKSEYESEAQWRIYCGSGSGVAIRSSRQRIYYACEETDEHLDTLMSFPIFYIDYETSEMPCPGWMAPYRFKRKSFEHEKELRFMVSAHPEEGMNMAISSKNEKGLRLLIDPNRLVEAVNVSPHSPDWFLTLVKDICTKYELSAPVNQSSLALSQPLFAL